MSRKSYIPPSMQTLRLRNVPLLQVQSIVSDDVDFDISGFDEEENIDDI